MINCNTELKHPEKGLAFSLLYKSIISLLSFSGSFLYFTCNLLVSSLILADFLIFFCCFIVNGNKINFNKTENIIIAQP